MVIKCCTALIRFPAVIEKFWALRSYLFLHKELRGVCDNDRLLLVNPKVPQIVLPIGRRCRPKSVENLAQ